MLVLKGHTTRLEHIAFSPDGVAVFAPNWREVQVWRPVLNAGTPTTLPVRFANSLHFTPDGNGLFTSGYQLNYVNLATGQATELANGGTCSRFALAHGGGLYIRDRLRIGSEGPIMTAHSTAGDELWTRPAPNWWGQPLFLPGDDEFICLEFEGQSRREQRFRIAVRSAATGEELRRSAPLADEVRDWTLSPDGSLVACMVTVWLHIYPLHEPFTNPLTTIRNERRKEFTAIAFHPSGKFLAATSNDETVKLYDTTTWKLARTFTWNIGKMRSICFSRDGTLAAAGSDKGKIVVWDVDL